MKLRMATWNLGRPKLGSTKRVRALQQHMAVVDADVWVLTETWDAIAPSPDHRLIARSASALDRDADRGELWTAIWSRYPGKALLLEAEPDHRLECLTAGVRDPLRYIAGRASIDHLCVSQDLACSGAGAWPEGVLPKGLTDHFGVWADIEWTEGRK